MDPEYLRQLGTAELWQILLSLVGPVIISMITQVKWPKWVKTLVMVAYVLLISTVTEALTGTLHLETWLKSVILVLVITTTVYARIMKPSGAADAIERTVNPGSPSREATDGERLS